MPRNTRPTDPTGADDLTQPIPVVDGAPPAVAPDADAPASSEGAAVAADPAAGQAVGSPVEGTPAEQADTIDGVSEQPDTTSEPDGLEPPADAAARSRAEFEARQAALDAQTDAAPDADDTTSED